MNEPDFAAQLAQARLASRWTVAYTQRVLGYVRAFEDGIQAKLQDVSPDLQFKFEHWQPHRHAPPPNQSTAPHHGRWVWDFLPLLSCTFRWYTAEKPKAGAIRVALRIELDGGWPKASAGEPDPLKFDHASDCGSPVSVWVYRIIEATGSPTWNCPSKVKVVPADLLEDGKMHTLGDESLSFNVLRTRTDLSKLPKRASVEQLLVEPIAAVFTDR